MLAEYWLELSTLDVIRALRSRGPRFGGRVTLLQPDSGRIDPFCYPDPDLRSPTHRRKSSQLVRSLSGNYYRFLMGSSTPPSASGLAARLRGQGDVAKGCCCGSNLGFGTNPNLLREVFFCPWFTASIIEETWSLHIYSIPVNLFSLRGFKANDVGKQTLQFEELVFRRGCSFESNEAMGPFHAPALQHLLASDL